MLIFPVWVAAWTKGFPLRPSHLCSRISSITCELPGLRVNKFFTTHYSRRETDRLIADGCVRINGKPAMAGDRVFEGDHVTLVNRDSETFPLASLIGRATPPDGGHVYLKHWKQRGVTCTTDSRIKGNVIDALGRSNGTRVFLVGRLDKESDGLLLLTSDGRLSNAVLGAASKHEKRYIVTADRAVGDSALLRLSQGVVISTTLPSARRVARTLTAPTLPCHVKRISSAVFEVTLREGRNRQIRRMCAALGFRVARLHREAVMGIVLGELRPGDWKALDDSEMRLVTAALQAPCSTEGTTPAHTTPMFGRQEGVKRGSITRHPKAKRAIVKYTLPREESVNHGRTLKR